MQIPRSSPSRRVLVFLGGVVILSGAVLGVAHSATRAGAAREFKISAHKYAFEPDHFEVDRGDHVRFLVTSVDADHGIAIKKLKVKSTVPEGETGVVEFDATEAGTFDITCADWCGKGHKQMRAILVVRESGTR
jgi:cytochrome c oxidase subunit 2